jgi:hypothetical protein
VSAGARSSSPPGFGFAPPPSSPYPPAYGRTWAPEHVVTKPKPSSARSLFLRIFGVAVLVASFFAGRAVVRHFSSDSPYTAANEVAFVKGCTGAGGSESACWCMIEWMEDNVSARDVKAFAKLVESPGYTHAQDPPWVLQGGRACANAQ